MCRSYRGGYAYLQGPSFQTLMSLRAGRSTESGNQTWQIRSLNREAAGQHQYDAGYQAGRTACLRTASAAAALAVLEAKRDVSPAYAAGFEWALWDYNDANVGATSESTAGHW